MHRKLETQLLAHGTNCPFFLFQPTSANLRMYFPLKPISVCLLHYWPALPCFKSFVL